MNTSPLQSRSSSQTAFTLIELLVVITIIAVLAGLLLPVTQKVLENSRKVSCKNTELQIVTAVNSYQTEYGQYPVPVTTTSTTATTPSDTTFGTANGDFTNNGQLFQILRALNQTENNVLLNPRKIVYFESKNVRNATEPKDGFIVTGNPMGNSNAPTRSSLKPGDLVDPWGNWYAVRFDSNYSNAVKNPYKSDAGGSDGTDDAVDPTSGPTQAQLKETLRTGVIAWSYGYDGQIGNKGASVTSPYTPTPGDDVDSWQ